MKCPAVTKIVNSPWSITNICNGKIDYLTADLEVACRYLHQFVKDCINYKRLDLLLKIVNKCKWPLAKYVAQHGFWEDKIKQWNMCTIEWNILLNKELAVTCTI